MFLILLKLIWVVVQALFTIGILLFLLGVARLLYGWRVRYSGPLDSRFRGNDTGWQNILRKGDIILTGKQSIFHSFCIQLANVLTRKIKHRFWTHAVIYQGEGKVWEARSTGVKERDLSEYIRAGYYVRAFRHRYISKDEILDKVIRFCASKKGIGYDLRGAVFYGVSVFVPVGFDFLFDNPAVDKLFQVENTYFCSELIVDAFCDAGYPISPFDGWRVKPADFIGNPLLNEVGS